ncbi:hypothetical protein DICPUDRAFT_38535, partial [Dictyostelium purpureum]
MWGKLVANNSLSSHIDLYEDDISLGRNPRKCKVVLHDPTISGIHCRIFRATDGHFYNGAPKYLVKITDLSSNGTFVKGNLLGKGRTTIISNDDIISFTSPRTNTGLSFTFADMSNPPPEETDEIYKNYILQGIIGTGNFSVVKRCIRRDTGQVYAVKIIDKKKFWHIGKNRNQIQSEINILKQIKHKHIIGIIEVYDSERHMYIILELASGGDLFDKIKNKGIYSERETKIVFFQILEAVAYLHNLNITHRDLKPENILLHPNCRGEPVIKISDFGLAKIISDKDKATTLCGTPLYVAPEIIKNCFNNNPNNVPLSGYGKEVDVWSLGCILYVLLSGRPPFDFDKVSSHKVLEEPVTFDLPIWGSVSNEAKELINKFLQHDPKKRLSARDALIDKWFSSDQFYRTRTEVVTPSP